MAGFQGFGYKAPEEIIAETQAGFQRALQSGNKDAMRAAIAQQAAFAIGGSPELRKARKTEKVLKDAQREAPETGDDLADQMEFYKRARVAALDAGLPDIAMQAAQNATQLRIMQFERNRLLAKDQREATKDAFDIQKTLAQTEKLRRETDLAGTTSFGKNVIMADDLTAAIESGQLSPEMEARARRNLGYMRSKILKDSTIVGRTEQDIRSDPVAARSMFQEIADKDALIANIDDSAAALRDLDNFEVTRWAGWGNDILGFMEHTFGREPTESEQEFMARIQEKEGKPSILAANVRHALTGAQMSAFEIVYLEPFLPSPTDPVSVMLNKLSVVRDYMKLDADTRLALFQEGLTERFFNDRGLRSNVGVETEEPGLGNPADPLSPLDAAIAERENSNGQ